MTGTSSSDIRPPPGFGGLARPRAAILAVAMAASSPVALPTVAGAREEIAQDAAPAASGRGRTSLRVERKRNLALFGFSAVLHAAGTGFAFFFSLEGFGLRDVPVEITYGIVLGVLPLADASLGYGLGRRFGEDHPPFGSTLLGSLLASCLTYGLLLGSMERDDPEADGKYDADDYFGADRKGVGVLTLIMAPILLPAIGAAAGYLLGKRTGDEEAHHATGLQPRRGAVFHPPVPRVFETDSRRDRAVPGMSFSIFF